MMILLTVHALCSVGFAKVHEPFLREAVESSPPVVSSSQRFVFRGFHRKDGLKLSSWTEKVATKLEKVVGISVPFQQTEMIRFSAHDSEVLQTGRIQLRQSLLADLLQQRIGLENPHLLEEEEILEGFVAVLLYRYMVAAYLVSGWNGQPVVPDWFSVGVAQLLQPGLRDRNTAFVLDEWKAGRGRRVAEIVDWKTLPAGRVPQKAYCGLLVDWLQKPIRQTFGWSALFKRMAFGDSLSVPWIQDDLLNIDDTRTVEKAWDVYVASKSEVNRDWGALTFDQVADLKRILTRHMSKERRSGYSPTSELQLEDLILMREEAWVTVVAEDMLIELAHFSVGQAPRIREVSEAYQRFFQALQTPKRMDPTFRFTMGGHNAVLQNLLSVANDAMQELEKEVVMRSIYMNQIEVARPVAPGEKVNVQADRGGHAVYLPGTDTSKTQSTGSSLEERRKSYLDALEAEQAW